VYISTPLSHRQIAERSLLRDMELQINDLVENQIPAWLRAARAFVLAAPRREDGTPPVIHCVKFLRHAFNLSLRTAKDITDLAIHMHYEDSKTL